MRVLIAADKFKGSLTSLEVCNAIAEGLKMASGHFRTEILPLSDGGDGLIAAIAYYTGACQLTSSVSDPLFRQVNAPFLISEDSGTVFIEMAQASGLNLLKPEEYNCALTSTYGTGELIKKALEIGAQEIVLGIGGSATNDCGAGMAAALGYRFFNKAGNEINPTGGNLIEIARIDSSSKVDFSGIRIRIACDVTNVLTGSEGASKVYARQKGANQQIVEELETGMLHFAGIVKRDLGIDILTIKGGGAAGGTGAGAVAFLNGELVSGTELIFGYSKFEEKLKEADLVITGEGKIDRQTLHGKLIHGITQLSTKYQKPVIAICGTLDLNSQEIEQLKLRATFSILNRPMLLEEASQQTSELLQETAANLGRLMLLRI